MKGKGVDIFTQYICRSLTMYRRALMLNRSEVARRVGVDPNTIKDLEACGVSKCRDKVMRLYSNEYSNQYGENLSLNDFIPELFWSDNEISIVIKDFDERSKLTLGKCADERLGGKNG